MATTTCEIAQSSRKKVFGEFTWAQTSQNAKSIEELITVITHTNIITAEGNVLLF